MHARESVSWLRHESQGYAAALAATDLHAPVAGCPGWTVRELTVHLGGVHRWATGILQTGSPQGHADGPVPDSELVAWFGAGADTLATVLDGTDPATPAWTFAAPPTAAFWFRRMAVETALHRVDVQRCTGPAAPVSTDLAVDGIGEVVESLAPRQAARQGLPEPTTAIELRTTDADACWRVGPGEPAATLSGPAEQLLLLLWRRADRVGLHVAGDAAALEQVLARALTP